MKPKIVKVRLYIHPLNQYCVFYESGRELVFELSKVPDRVRKWAHDKEPTMCLSHGIWWYEYE